MTHMHTHTLAIKFISRKLEAIDFQFSNTLHDKALASYCDI